MAIKYWLYGMSAEVASALLLQEAEKLGYLRTLSVTEHVFQQGSIYKALFGPYITLFCDSNW